MPALVSEPSISGFRVKEDYPDDITLETNFANMLDERVKSIEIEDIDHPDDITLETSFAEMLEEKVKCIEIKDTEINRPCKITLENNFANRLDEKVKGIEIEQAKKKKKKKVNKPSKDEIPNKHQMMDDDLIDTEIVAMFSASEPSIATESKLTENTCQSFGFDWLSCDMLLDKVSDMLFHGLDEVDDRTAADAAKDAQMKLAMRDMSERLQRMERETKRLQRINRRLNGLESSEQETEGSVAGPVHSEKRQASAAKVAPEKSNASANRTPKDINGEVASAPEPDKPGSKSHAGFRIGTCANADDPLGDEADKQSGAPPRALGTIPDDAAARGPTIAPRPGVVEVRERCDVSSIASPFACGEEADVIRPGRAPGAAVPPGSRSVPDAPRKPRSVLRPSTYAGRARKKSVRWGEPRIGPTRKESRARATPPDGGWAQKDTNDEHLVTNPSLSAPFVPLAFVDTAPDFGKGWAPSRNGNRSKSRKWLRKRNTVPW